MPHVHTVASMYFWGTKLECILYLRIAHLLLSSNSCFSRLRSTIATGTVANGAPPRAHSRNKSGVEWASLYQFKRSRSVNLAEHQNAKKVHCRKQISSSTTVATMSQEQPDDISTGRYDFPWKGNSPGSPEFRAKYPLLMYVYLDISTQCAARRLELRPSSSTKHYA
jgi:hypothetical protein